MSSKRVFDDVRVFRACSKHFGMLRDFLILMTMLLGSHFVFT
jgi:hypothetical protein